MKINIIVKFQFEGIHQWSACPHKRVEFLKYPHRHIFHVVAKKEVSHDDRDIEIIMLKRDMGRTFSAHKVPAELGETSCEQLAVTFIEAFNLNYCSVLEDNENGAEVFAEQTKEKQEDIFDSKENVKLTLDNLFNKS